MAGGALPLGTPGELDFQEISSCANRISELAADARDGGRQPPLPFEARLPSGRVLFGSLNESYAHGLVEQQFARIRASHLLSLWIRHLVYCWVAPGGSEAQSSLFGRPLQGGGAVHQRFRPVEAPAARLDALARRFDQGQALPLLLFPTTSLAYARAARSVSRSPGAKRDAFAGLDKEWQLELQRDSHLQRVYGADKSFAELRREHQAEFELGAVDGTMVGFWSPPYASGVEVAGYHLHFLTDDRTAGGHVLDCRGRALRVRVQEESDVHLALPGTAAFRDADLTRDPTADLDRAER